MTDLRTLLDEAAGPAAPVSPTVVEADLSRGHRALRRHRARTLGACGGLVASLALGAVAVASSTGLLTDPSPSASSARPAVVAPTTPAPLTVAQAPTALVAYIGAQPPGYTLATIPAGYRIAGSERFYLTLEREDARGSDPALYDDKIAVFQSVDADPQGGEAVTVRGQPATIIKHAGLSFLYLRQDNGSYLEVQVAAGLNWDNAQLIEFASGITVTQDAELTYG